MILPTKHTNFSESLLGFGSYILNSLESSKSIDNLWNQYQYDYHKDLYHAKHSFDNLLLTIVFLYSIGAVEEQDGVVKKCIC
ncbi:ABC-three component system middle component 6 [Methanolobus sp. ZRKC5]|uniref:ABC-three component system middle component 6 n=1 Tax=unclassified Methanolobus TaxID=2629569 RepID=UPI00313C06A0